MLNDALQTEFSPAGQKSYNKRLKEIESYITNLGASFQTGSLEADTANLKEIISEAIKSGSVTAEQLEAIEAKMDNLVASIADIGSLHTSSIENDNGITTKDLQADSAELKDIKSSTIENSGILKTSSVEADYLSVANIIDSLNLKELKIDSKVALSTSAYVPLWIAEGFEQVAIKSTQRPKWNNDDLAVISDINTPFTLRGIVAESADLPTDAANGDSYLVKSPLSLAIWSEDSNKWFAFDYPALSAFRTSADQDTIDHALEEAIADVSAKADANTTAISTLSDTVSQNKAAQDSVNETFTADIERIDQKDAEQDAAIDEKLSDAPKDGKTYGRKDGDWVDFSADSEYLNKTYESHEQYFVDKTLTKRPAYQVSSLKFNKDGVDYYLGLWTMSPAEAGNLEYTSKNMYDFVLENKAAIDQENENCAPAVIAAYEANRILTLPDSAEKDILTPFSSEVDGNTVKRSDGALLGKTTITNDEDGLVVSTSLGFKTQTPTPASDEKTVINREYIDQNLSISTTLASSGTQSAVLTHGRAVIDTITPYARNYGGYAAIDYPTVINHSRHEKHTKNYVYYKVDNTKNQPASSSSWWMSLDKDGNIINMTNPREDKGLSVANQTMAEGWLVYHPDSWTTENQDVAYWPHCDTTYGGYITIFDKGRFSGYVEDKDGQTKNLYQVVRSDKYPCRGICGKSLRGDKSRILLVNNHESIDYYTKAMVIGVDADGNEGLNKCKPITLPDRIKWGYMGVAAGKKHFFFQNEITNVFCACTENGTVASYVLSDPVTQTALSATTCENAQENYIELENGDCMFMIRDKTAQICYFIYCNDNFEEEGIEPFTVYRSSVDYTNAASTSGFPLCRGNPFVEFGDFIYFFPTQTIEESGTCGWAVTVAMTSQYSRFNKSTKTWSDAVAPWSNYEIYCGFKPVKTHDFDENEDYLWVFQANTASTSAVPVQSQCMLISKTGTIQYIDLGTGSTIHWFDNTAAEGQTLMADWIYNTGVDGNVKVTHPMTSRPCVPFVAVTEEGVGMLLSNACRDICVFYGNGHFAVYSYTDNHDGGPWPLLSTSPGYIGPAFVGGKYGCKLYTRINNTIATTGLGDGEQWTCVIYIKPSGEDKLSEPTFYMKPMNEGAWDKSYYLPYVGMDYAESDMSNYEHKFINSIRPLNGQYREMTGATWYETELIPKSSTLFLKDGTSIISSTAL